MERASSSAACAFSGSGWSGGLYAGTMQPTPQGTITLLAPLPESSNWASASLSSTTAYATDCFHAESCAMASYAGFRRDEPNIPTSAEPTRATPASVRPTAPAFILTTVDYQVYK